MERSDLAKFKLPDAPGVYTFKKGRRILYIGKAASLRDRVRSYFSKDLAESRGLHIRKMVAEADRVEWEQTHSVLEALILEANHIKRFLPPYNAAAKDNTSFNYLVITKEEYPQILIVRGRELFQGWKKAQIKHLFGPFPQGMSLKEAVKMVRRIFPFRDRACVPCIEQQKRNANKPCKPCFNRHLGLCPGVCTGEISKAEYAATVRHIATLFSGNFKGLKRQLTSRMRAAAEGERFEDAAELKRQIDALTHIKDVSLIRDERVSAGGGVRIEAYDVAHTAGKETVGVMTVVDGGEAVKAAYRMFKIQGAANNDVAALKEVLERRLGHPEWPLPRVMVVDGGRAQMRTAERVLKMVGVAIPLVGVVKDERHQPKGLIGDRRAIEAHDRDILLANHEAHRFAISWHRKRRGRIA